MTARSRGLLRDASEIETSVKTAAIEAGAMKTKSPEAALVSLSFSVKALGRCATRLSALARKASDQFANGQRTVPHLDRAGDCEHDRDVVACENVVRFGRC